MARDSALQQRIDRLQAEARNIQVVIDDGPWADRPARRAQLARVNRRLAMLLEDERRPTFASPAQFGKADEYTAWRKEQGI